MARVLIAEDELIISMPYEYYLSRTGHEIVGIVVSGEEAIAAAREFRPDLILLDIQLADEMNGYSVAEEIRKFSDCKIVFISGNARTDVVEKTSHITNSQVLIKPVDQKELESIVTGLSVV